MDFEAVYRENEVELRRIARNAWMPGMDADDIYSELLVCLWKATTTYDAGSETKFQSYWWSLWLNRRKDLLRAYYAQRRGDAIPFPELPDKVVTENPFPSIRLDRWEEQAVWMLLGYGFTATEIQALVPRRRYYQIIQSWRTPDVRKALLD